MLDLSAPSFDRPLSLGICKVLHVVNHVWSTKSEPGDRGLAQALEAGHPSVFDGGEGVVLRCIEELETCIKISERHTTAQFICRCGQAVDGFVGACG